MLLTILGWVGAVVILAGYALFSLGKLPNGPVYQLSNLVGAFAISLNVAAHGAWPSAVVNVVWAIIAAVVLVRMARARSRTRRLVAEARHDETHERRMQDVERAHLVTSFPADSLPAVTAALAVVALAAAHQQHPRDPEFAPGAEPASTAV
ncbi:hypothetical protein GCM10025867_13090 [Frondihabitans sucicola]|uniref:CBU-0592-like domain-containing protein n=1 Tax=Frondihabitans sucicola TaxID=1268041 RepID=A0ABM8GL22_9MICO|nr:hypothetical protein [Frondihabitans sucicola]BDZ49068.1 hypothetical protein GCM10025867_13090 [Frondihabitans sucicola]